jgi:uncharacterized protein YndB with AHSA1/START domain
LALVERVTIRATPERVFEFWTEPGHLVQWFGPEGAVCVAAEVDLKIGGRYRIGNRFPDGSVHWIAGAFELIEKPARLVYSWGLEPAPSTERVTVKFVPQGDATEVTVIHENIPSSKVQQGHAKGWQGCFQGLRVYAESLPPFRD